MKIIDQLKNDIKILREGKKQDSAEQKLFLKAKEHIEKSKKIFVIEDLESFSNKLCQELNKKTNENWTYQTIYSFYKNDITHDPFYPKSESYQLHVITNLSQDDINILKKEEGRYHFEKKVFIGNSAQNLYKHINSGEIIPLQLTTYPSYFNDEKNKKYSKNLLSNQHLLSDVLDDSIEKTWQKTGTKSLYGYYMSWQSLPYKEHHKLFDLIKNYSKYEKVASLFDHVIWNEVETNLKNYIKEKKQAAEQKKIDDEIKRLTEIENKKSLIKKYQNDMKQTKAKVKQLKTELSQEQ